MHFDIETTDSALAGPLKAKIDSKTKPLGALGELENLALRVGLIQQTLTPRLVRPHIVVIAGDHGAARSGLSAYPQEVTGQMVENFLSGGAAINVFARTHGLGLSIVDAGVDKEFGPRKGLVSAKVARGTRSFLEGPAMTPAERDLAMSRGAELVDRLHQEGTNVLGLGEMGIGNTSSAAVLTHLLTGAPLDDCVGRGTGLDDRGLVHKRTLLRQAVENYHGSKAPLDLLAHFGGFEIAMMAGAFVAGARARMILLVDGFVVTSAVLVAARCAPHLVDYCVFAHRSTEPGHSIQLEALCGRPLLELSMRLGEGTGAALAYPILSSAVAFLNEMATFESALVSRKTTP